MRLKELEMQIDLGACANLNRTTDLKSGVQKVALSLQPGVYARFEHAHQCCQYIGGIVCKWRKDDRLIPG